ncbi:MAG TPA: metal ABC transporter permease [Oligella sp.]|nr:metal ABC transporter permease [Oligella sp.]
MRLSRCSVFTKFSSKLLSACLVSVIASFVSMSVWAESKLKVLTNFTVLLQSALIALFVVAVIGLKWRDFLLHAFDPIQARVVGLKNDFYTMGY